MTARGRHAVRIELTLFRVHAADDEAKVSQPAFEAFPQALCSLIATLQGKGTVFTFSLPAGLVNVMRSAYATAGNPIIRKSMR
jgi:hypothetical protein